MKVTIDGERVTLCDGCGTRLDGIANANKSAAAYGGTDPQTGRFVAKTNICIRRGCLRAWRGGLTEDEAIAAYRAAPHVTARDLRDPEQGQP